MLFTPNTIVYLIPNVPLDRTYQHTIDFVNETVQSNYFLTRSAFSYTNFTYERERQAIRIPANKDSIQRCNYVAYRNSNYNDKWFFAFIVDIEYVNPNTSRVIIEQDVMQTWLFDYYIRSAFIEREHVDNDNLFEHTLPENLELGPIIQGSVTQYDLSSMAIVLAYAPGNLDLTGGRVMDGVYTGVKYVWFGVTSAEVARLNSIISSFAEAGLLDDIISIFMVPAQFVLGGKASFEIKREFDEIDGYIPRNKKLFTYPFCYCAVNNCVGNEVLYRYELFRNPTDFIFNIAYAFNMESTCNCHPMNYANINQNWDQGVVLSGFPQCSWVGNIYANWFARNKLSVGTKLLQETGAVVSGVGASLATLNTAPGISAFNQIMSTVAQIGDKALFPYQIQGQAVCDVSNVKWGRVGFEFKTYTIRKEYAQIIDNFFDQFGYKVNRLGVPNIKTRQSYNYVKTQTIVIEGSMPTEHLEKIKSIYNNGVTFWHDPTKVGYYTLPNDILDPPPPPDWDNPTPAPDPGPGPDPGPDPDPGNWTYPFISWQNHVTSEYGWRADPITGEEKFHNGIDIGMPLGTACRAIAAGLVIRVASSNARGNYVDVQQSSSIFYRYQHCASILVSEGDRVTLGEDIATVGATGQVTGPHLHIEIFLEGSTVNPRNYIPLG